MERDTMINKLIALVGDNHLIINAPMKEHLSFKAGGHADFLVLPENITQLSGVLKVCRESELPFFLMGNGSNLLVRDGGFRGVIIKTRMIDTVTVDGNEIISEAGATLRKVAEEARHQSLSGLEFASGIPGTIGGAAVMNAGAYDGEMKDVVTAVEVIDPNGEICLFSADRCDFGYRHSIFQNSDYVITRVMMRLQPGDAEAIHQKMTDFNQRRRDKQPLEFPSAGSTFKRPEGYFAGKLIQDAGFRGFRIGDAQLSEKHCGFIVNRGDATAKDILLLIQKIQTGVKDRFGVDLQPEVIVIGEE